MCARGQRLGLVIAVGIAIATAFVFASSAPARYPGSLYAADTARIAHWRP